MPIVEYYCPNNHRIYQFYARNMADAEKVPLCPDGKSFLMRKQVSRFSVIRGVQEADPGDLFEGLSEQQVQDCMADLQQSYGQLDEKSLDPKALGSILKKIGERLGDRSSPELKELIRRLDRGEDPHELTKLFEDVEEERDLFTVMQSKGLISRAPIRDPKLYELRDYLADP